VYELKAFGDGISVVDGPRVCDMGIWFDTRMCVVKLSSGDLWLDSPVQIPPEAVERIKALGRVKYLIAATPRHVWRLEKWHGLFPAAELWVTPQIRNKVKLIMVLPRHELTYTGILRDAPPPAWANDLDQLIFGGSPLIKEVIFFHKASRTIILDDLIQSHQFVNGKPFHNALVRFGGVRWPGGVPRDIRLTFINRKLARQSLEKVLSWDFDKLIIAHGPCLEKNARPFVEKAFRWLG
jgi:hypothetical protein